eukprot:2396807-Rhodomonas_salina.1
MPSVPCPGKQAFQTTTNKHFHFALAATSTNDSARSPTTPCKQPDNPGSPSSRKLHSKSQPRLRKQPGHA